MALRDLYIAVGMLENQGESVSFKANSCYWKLLLKIYITQIYTYQLVDVSISAMLYLPKLP
jgi:hypothetical protein